MRKIILILTALLLLLPACFFGALAGSGELETRGYDFKDFNGIEVGGAFEVEVLRSNSYGISITIDGNLLDKLIVTKSGDTLRIRLQPGYIYSSYTALAKISLPGIQTLGLSGASTGVVRGFNSVKSFAVRLSGASSVDLTDMVAGDIRFEVSGASFITGGVVAGGDARFVVKGASSITLSGSANDLDADASGASNLRLEDFKVNNASIELSGASSGTVNLDGTLNAELSGVSHLSYIGQPKLGNINTSGGSSISRK